MSNHALSEEKTGALCNFLLDEQIARKWAEAFS